MAESFSLGSRLRELRKERNLSQRDLAGQAGVSANAISLIERSEISPSVATLHRLATTLKVKMSYFFESDEVQTNIICLKAGNHPSLVSKGITVAGIGQRLQAQEIEPFLITLASQAGSGRQPVIHLGHEFVYCLEGRVEYEIDGTVYVLEKGDTLLFEAELPHYWRNPAADNAQLLVVLQTPEGSEESVRRHFSSYPSLTHMG